MIYEYSISILFLKRYYIVCIILYEELCNKYYNVKYFDNYVKIEIVDIPNNKYDIGNVYFEVLEIFKLNKVIWLLNILIKYI